MCPTLDCGCNSSTLELREQQFIQWLLDEQAALDLGNVSPELRAISILLVVCDCQMVAV